MGRVGGIAGRDVLLVEADHLSPNHTDGEPDRGVHRADNETVAPPFALAHVTRAVVDGAAAVAVVGERNRAVREEAERKSRHQCRRTAGRSDCHERGVHRGNTGRHRREAVVRVGLTFSP